MSIMYEPPKNNERNEVALRPAQVPLQYRCLTFAGRTSAEPVILRRYKDTNKFWKVV